MPRTNYPTVFVSATPAELTDVSHPSGEVIASAAVPDGVYDMGVYEGFVVQITVWSVSGTSPTLDVVIQESNDGVNWMTLFSFTQFTAAGNKKFTIPHDATLGSAPILTAKFVRFTATVGGSATPTCITTVSFNPRG